MTFDRLPRLDLGFGTATLVEPLRYSGAAGECLLPAGFTTDFASVPSFLRWLVAPTGTYQRAAMVHDQWCDQLGVDCCEIPSRDVDRRFRVIAIEEGTPHVRAWLLWAGVRWGAIANPHRRSGWRADLPLLLLVSLLALLPVLLGTFAVALVAGCETVVETVVDRIGRRDDE